MRFLYLGILLISVATSAFAWDMMDVLFKPKGGGTVLFSHESHLARPSINGECGACHGKLLPVPKRPVSMAEMYKGKSCGGCHGKTAFSLDACDHCHAVDDVTFTVPRVGNVTFLHDPHTKSIVCWTCHPKLFNPGRNKPVTMAEMEKAKSCGACHTRKTGKQVFPLARCERCHKAQDILFKLNTAGPVTFSHAYHTQTKKYGCSDCHPKVFRLGYQRTVITMDEMERGESCGACHNGTTAFTVRENCVKCHDM